MAYLLKAENRLWIVGEQGTYLGEGRIALLQAIDKLGSISKAAKSMNMSYLKAWKLVNSMSNSTGKPIVVRTSGGKGGGGTTLTEEGLKAIELFTSLNNKCNKFLEQELQKLISKK